MGGKWENGRDRRALGLFAGVRFKQNQVCCGTGEEGSKCVNLLAVPPAIWTYLEFWYLGRRPGICIPGVQREGA